MQEINLHDRVAKKTIHLYFPQTELIGLKL